MARTTIPVTSLLFLHRFSNFSEDSSNSTIQHLYSEISSANAGDNDPAGFKDNVETIIRVWSKLAKKRLREEDLVQTFINCAYVTNLNELLKSDDLTSRFLCIAIRNSLTFIQEEIENNRIVQAADSINSVHSPLSCDIVIKLVSIIINNIPDGNPTRKLEVLNEGELKIGSQTVSTILHEHLKLRKVASRWIPYSLTEEQISRRVDWCKFMLDKFEGGTSQNVSYILTTDESWIYSYDPLTKQQFKSWVFEEDELPTKVSGAIYWTLIIDALKHLNELLRESQQNAQTVTFQENIRKLMTTLHGSYQDILVDYYYLICNKIPTNCIHIRNIILSTTPNYVKIPNPFASDLNVNGLVEITVPPRELMDSDTLILDPVLKSRLDSYLQTRAPDIFLPTLICHIKVYNEPGRHYDSQMMNDVILYVGIKAIAHINNIGEAVNTTTIANSAHMDIFQYLTVNFDYEGRHLFLNTIANQLRYPNSHTHYFSCCLLYLFARTNSEAVKEQITRMLVERLSVNSPHPWGLQMTVIELIKNPIFNFWSHDFIYCAPEIKK